MSALRLYAPTIVLGTWAAVGALSVHGYAVTLIGVVSILWAGYVHIAELIRRRDHRVRQF